jgi:hypothetical protein
LSDSLSHKSQSALNEGLREVEAGADQLLDERSSQGDHAPLSSQQCQPTWIGVPARVSRSIRLARARTISGDALTTI